MDRGKVTRDLVRTDFEEYFTRWQTTHWSLAGDLACQPVGNSRVRAAFKINFDVANQAENRRSTGQAAETLLLESDPGTSSFRIVGHHEKILERRLSSLGASTTPVFVDKPGPAATKASHVHSVISAADAQRVFDEAEVSSHVGQLLEKEAERVGLARDIKNEWNLPGELKSKWKAQLLDAWPPGIGEQGSQMNDQQMTANREHFSIPKEEDVFIVLKSNGDDLHHNNFEAAFTDKAVYLITKMPDQPSDGYTPDSLPSGRFRVSHRAFLATDSLDYGKGIVTPYIHPGLSPSEKWCLPVFGNWVVNGKTALEFANAWPETYHYTANGEFQVDSGVEPHEFQQFIIRVAALDLTYAVEDARQRHLEEKAGQNAQTEPNRADTLSGYLGVPWGSSFVDVRQKLAAKAAQSYREVHISEAEWSRGYAGVGQEIRRFTGWSVPLRPPLSFFTFTDETGVKTFLFHRDRLYAVTNLSDRDWVQRNGVGALLAMCRKYGQPSLHFARSWTATNDVPLAPRDVDYGSELIRAVWESDSGAIFAPLKATKSGNHLNIHPLRNSYVSVSIPPENINWTIHVEAAGFVPPNTGKEGRITLKAPSLDNGRPRDVSVQFPSIPTAEVKGKLLALILNIGWSKPEDSATSNSAALANLSSKVRVTDQRNNSYKPVFSALSPRDILPLDHQYPPGHGDAEWFAFFDIPKNVEDLSLQTESPEITDLAGNKVQTQGVQIIDLEQTKYQWICVGLLTEKEMEEYQFSIAGATTYVSMPIFREMAQASEAHRAEQERKKKDVEKKRQKELEEKF